MSVNIQIRDVPEEIRNELAAAAKANGQSMQAYLADGLRELLRGERRRRQVTEMFERTRAARERSGTHITAEEMVAGIAADRAERDEQLRRAVDRP